MCSCGKYKRGEINPDTNEPDDSDYRVGYVQGFYEIHTRDYCKKEKLPRWRYAIFSPLIRLGAKLAGAHPGGEAARAMYYDYRKDVRIKRIGLRRAQLESFYDKMTGE